MKILHISTYPPKEKKHSDSGGVSSYTKNLVASIPYEKEDQVFVLCNKLEGGLEIYQEKGTNIVRCFDKDFRFIFQLLKEVRNKKPDIVHIQQELSLYGNVVTSYLLQCFLFFLHNYHTVITLHGVVSLKNIDREFIKENNSNLPVFLVKFAFQVIYKPLCWYSKKIIVHEELFKEILIKEYFIESNKIEVIPHGVEDLKTTDSVLARKNLNLPLDQKIVLFMGYLTGYKGLDLLIEGFSKFLEMNKNSILIIGAGYHPKYRNDENYIKEYSRIKNKASEMLGKNHRWVGFIEEQEINTYFSASNVSIYPYTNHLASSGPMSLSIGYEKPFLASEVFENLITNKEMIFKKNPEDFAKTLASFFEKEDKNIKIIKEMKNNSLWSNVGTMVYKNCYLSQ